MCHYSSVLNGVLVGICRQHCTLNGQNETMSTYQSELAIGLQDINIPPGEGSLGSVDMCSSAVTNALLVSDTCTIQVQVSVPN